MGLQQAKGQYMIRNDDHLDGNRMKQRRNSRHVAMMESMRRCAQVYKSTVTGMPQFG